MKKWFTVGILLLSLGALGAQGLPRLALSEFSSASLSAGKVGLLTDAFRTELLKSGLFTLQEQTWAPGTRPAGVDKGAAGNVEAFGALWVISIKVTDLATGTLDFSKTAQVEGEELLFRAIRELTNQLSARYRVGTPAQAEAQWKALGAEGPVLAALTAAGEGAELYLSLRQYDGSVTPAQFLELREKKIDTEALLALLQAGFSYRDCRRALSLGITRLDRFESSFKPAGFGFSDYLDAYALGFSTAEEYKRYRAEAQRDYISLGMGGVADTLPLVNTDFKFFIGQVAWEHSWMSSPREWYRVNSEAGVFLLGLLIPTPYASLNVMTGSAPFFVKAGIGGHAELLVGGHSAIHFRLGVEVASRFEFTVIAVPLGTEPAVNYVGGFQKWEGPSDGPIRFPYYGLLFTYKIPVTP